jgi:hypothetical protein
MGNNVSDQVGNYVSVRPLQLGNYVSADNWGASEGWRQPGKRRTAAHGGSEAGTVPTAPAEPGRLG